MVRVNQPNYSQAIRQRVTLTAATFPASSNNWMQTLTTSACFHFQSAMSQPPRSKFVLSECSHAAVVRCRQVNDIHKGKLAQTASNIIFQQHTLASQPTFISIYRHHWITKRSNPLIKDSCSETPALKQPAIVERNVKGLSLEHEESFP